MIDGMNQNCKIIAGIVPYPHFKKIKNPYGGSKRTRLCTAWPCYKRCRYFRRNDTKKAL